MKLFLRFVLLVLSTYFILNKISAQDIQLTSIRNDTIYTQWENALSIDATGMDCKDFLFKQSNTNHYLNRQSCYTYFFTDKTGAYNIEIYKIDRQYNDTFKVGNKTFYAIDIGFPKPCIMGVIGNKIEKNILPTLKEIGFEQNDAGNKYKITSYTISCIYKNGYAYSVDVNGSKFTSDVFVILNRLQSGDKLLLDNIHILIRNSKNRIYYYYGKGVSYIVD